MSKQLIFGTKAREALMRGINTVADAVGETLGPRSRNVSIGMNNSVPWIVHDGVTVARSISLSDPFEDQGAKLLWEVAGKTNDKAGDGTTTSTILAQALSQECIKYIEAGHNPMQLKEEIEQALVIILKRLQKLSKKVSTDEEIEQIATISSGDPIIGKLVSEALKKVGEKGVVTVEEGSGFETTVTYKEGLEFDKGLSTTSQYFVTNQSRVEAIVENPYILLTDLKLSHDFDVVPFLEKFIQTSKDLVVICGELSAEALATLVVNKLRGHINVIAVQAPAFGGRRQDELEDLAILTGGAVIKEDSGRTLESVEIDELGRADKVIIDRDNTTLLGGKGIKTAIDRRIHDLSDQIKVANTDYDKEIKMQRMAKLAGGVAIIQVGAATEPEQKEKKERVIDAVNATKAAVEEGIVAGGEITLLNISRKPIKDTLGEKVLLKALKMPFWRLITNSGMDYAEIRESLSGKDYPFGIDVIDKQAKDLIAAGIIDPVKVVRFALENAVSIASMLSTTSVLIADEVEK